jgi:hypothetical protein
MKLGVGLPTTMAHETDRKLMLDGARLADEGRLSCSGHDRQVELRLLGSARDASGRRPGEAAG